MISESNQYLATVGTSEFVDIPRSPQDDSVHTKCSLAALRKCERALVKI